LTFYKLPLPISRIQQNILLLGFTAVLTAYFLPWLPHPAAGLRLIGLEMGEWVKFLPQVRSGEISASRDWFYLPPVTLGLALALSTSHWPNGRWQTWATRVLAVWVSLLAFPAIEAIRGESADNYLFRLQLIGLVAGVAAVSSLGRYWPPFFTWLLLAILGLVGAAVPTWIYLVMRPAIGQLLATSVATGPGVWLNLVGHGLITAVSLWVLWRGWRLAAEKKTMPLSAGIVSPRYE
jgi:hypothetical protein